MKRRINNNHISLIRLKHGSSGFTLIELVFVILLLFILIAMAYPIYMSYVDKAKVTVAISALDSIQKSLESYHLDNNKYPDNIDFSNCMDDQGHSIFPSDFCTQINKDLDSPEYAIGGSSYIVKAKARDKKHTKLTLNAVNITKEGN